MIERIETTIGNLRVYPFVDNDSEVTGLSPFVIASKYTGAVVLPRKGLIETREEWQKITAAVERCFAWLAEVAPTETTTTEGETTL